MKRILLVAAILLGSYGYFNGQHGAPSTDQRRPAPVMAAANSGRAIADAFTNQRSNLQVSGQGVVVKVLRDDLSGSRHQRFIIRLASGQTLLVAHNIDLAPRLDGLREGETVQFAGEYEWNPSGGVLHWTHRDPGGSHPAGWLQYHGRRYQ